MSYNAKKTTRASNVYSCQRLVLSWEGVFFFSLVYLVQNAHDGVMEIFKIHHGIQGAESNLFFVKYYFWQNTDLDIYHKVSLCLYKCSHHYVLCCLLWLCIIFILFGLDCFCILFGLDCFIFVTSALSEIVIYCKSN